MITLIEGMPRAGKTYYAVQDVLKKYYNFDEVSLKWVKKDENTEVFSNVDRFLVSRDLLVEIKKAGGVKVFFSNDFQKVYSREKRHVYIIDEAQSPMFFHRKFIDIEVFYFFQYHGHFAIDIYLITQDVGSLARELQSINEYHIKAVRRSYAFGNEFRYNFMVGNEIFRKRVLKKDLRVFSAYRSTVDVAGQKGQSFSKRYYIYVIGFVFMAVIGFYVMLKWRFSPPADDVKTVKVVEGNKNFKIVALYGDNALVKNLVTKKLQRVAYDNISGDMRIGAVVCVKM